MRRRGGFEKNELGGRAGMEPIYCFVISAKNKCSLSVVQG